LTIGCICFVALAIAFCPPNAKGKGMLEKYEMDDILITNCFEDWKQARPSRKTRIANKILKKLGISERLVPPIHTGGMTSVEQRVNMFHLASSVLAYKIPGDFVELGCHAGQSAVLFQKIIEHYDKNRTLHVYDSFEGLPEINPLDGRTPLRKGDMATSQEALLLNFSRAGLKPPVIHTGWFENTLKEQLPEKIAFAHLDGDLYDSIRVSLEYVYPKLSKGAVCLIDDYSDPALFDSVNDCPGVKQACDEFLHDKPEQVALLYGGYDSNIGYGSHGFFRKL
jgi:O-methyltransferase